MGHIFRITRHDAYVNIRVLSPLLTPNTLTLTPEDLVRTEEGFKPAPQATDEEILAALFAPTPSLASARAKHLYRVVRHPDKVTVQRYLNGEWQEMVTLQEGDWFWSGKGEEKPIPLKEASDAEILMTVLSHYTSEGFALVLNLVIYLLLLAILVTSGHFALQTPLWPIFLPVLVVAALIWTYVVIKASCRLSVFRKEESQ